MRLFVLNSIQHATRTLQQAMVAGALMKGGGRYQQLHLNCNIKVEISQFRMFCNAIEHKYIFIFPGRLALGVNCILSTEYSF